MKLTRTMARTAGNVAHGIRQAFRGVMVRNDNARPNIGAEVRGLAGEALSAELLQHYGFTSAPLPGAEAVVLPLGGNSNHSIVIATADGRYRLKVKDGEVALWTDEGDHIHLKRGREIEVETRRFVVKASQEVVLDTPMVKAAQDVEIAGNAAVEGDVAAQGQVADGVRSLADDRAIYNGHDHRGDDGGTTSTPNQQQ